MTEEVLFDHKLKRGKVYVTRTIDNGIELMKFDARIDTDYPADLLFEQVIQGFIDSEKSWVWPNKYESAPEPLDFDLYEGCQVQMTYYLPRWDDLEKTMPGVTYKYKLKRYRPEERIFQYESVDHPLQGGGTFTAIPTGESTSQFHWHGAYKPTEGADKILFALRQYLPVLYEVFEENLEKGRPQRPAA